MFSVENFLQALHHGSDVVVKASSDLPFVEMNSDVDIYSLDPNGLVERLIARARKAGYERLNTQHLTKAHLQLDVLSANTLLFRFDIYSGFPDFERFDVKPALFALIIGSSIPPNPELTLPYPRPAKLHDSLLRYLEYCEFYWTGPEKNHHLEWILSNLSDEELSHLFLLSHHYVTPKFDKFAPTARRATPLLRAVSYLARFQRIRKITPAPIINFIRTVVRRLNSNS